MRKMVRLLALSAIIVSCLPSYVSAQTVTNTTEPYNNGVVSDLTALDNWVHSTRTKGFKSITSAYFMSVDQARNMLASCSYLGGNKEYLPCLHRGSGYLSQVTTVGVTTFNRTKALREVFSSLSSITNQVAKSVQYAELSFEARQLKEENTKLKEENAQLLNQNGSLDDDLQRGDKVLSEREGQLRDIQNRASNMARTLHEVQEENRALRQELGQMNQTAGIFEEQLRECRHNVRRLRDREHDNQTPQQPRYNPQPQPSTQPSEDGTKELKRVVIQKLDSWLSTLSSFAQRDYAVPRQNTNPPPERGQRVPSGNPRPEESYDRCESDYRNLVQILNGLKSQVSDFKSSLR